MQIGTAEYGHEEGDCYNRKIAKLSGPCGDPRCVAARMHDYHTVIATAAKFLGWYRTMVIQDQIRTTDYALRLKPCDDWNLTRALELYSEDSIP